MLSKILTGRFTARASQVVTRGVRAVSVPLANYSTMWERTRVVNPVSSSMWGVPVYFDRSFATSTMTEKDLFAQKLDVVSSFEKAIDLIDVVCEWLDWFVGLQQPIFARQSTNSQGLRPILSWNGLIEEASLICQSRRICSVFEHDWQGTVCSTGRTLLKDMNGRKLERFCLSEVFGLFHVLDMLRMQLVLRTFWRHFLIRVL